MKACITGVAGFLGSRLASYLKARGWDIWGIDDYSTGSLLNVEPYVANAEKHRFYEGDVRDGALLDRVFRDVQVVFHAAASVGVTGCMERPFGTWENNWEATKSVLAHAGERRVVFFSAPDVYGPELPVGVPESFFHALPETPRWSFAACKRAEESLALAQHYETGLDVRIARIFPVAGAGQSPSYGAFIPGAVMALKRGKPILVAGDGLQTRTYLHVEDFCRAMEILGSLPGGVGEVFNVGGFEEHSILNVARLVLAQFPESSSRVEFVTPESFHGPSYREIQRQGPDISKFSAWASWSPRRTLIEAVQEIVEDMEGEQ